MRKLILFVTMAATFAGCGRDNDERTLAAAAAAQQRTGGGNAASPRPGGAPGGAFERPPMTVELATVSRELVTEQLMMVGNLIGAATVEVVPKVNGRLESVFVRLGDPVTKGRAIAKVEDREIREQVNQARAAHEVAQATIRQREADLKFAETNLERSRNLFARQLLPRQTMDDADARHQAAVAQLDLARAQFSQSKSRLGELQLTLENTVIVSPVNGFVGKRYLDPGAFVSSSAPVASVVDIHLVRLVASLVEKDIRRVSIGTAADTEVDAYAGETFVGRVARVSPVLDPATRTAPIEIEIPNPGFRLKPGMYARVKLTVDQRQNALVVPRNALVDLDGKRGVFVAAGNTAKFRTVATGLQDEQRLEVTEGVAEGEKVVTTGAGALRDGDRILLASRTEPGAPPPSNGGPRPPDPGASSR